MTQDSWIIQTLISLSYVTESTVQSLNMATSVEDRTLTYDEVFGSMKSGKITLIDVREVSELKETGPLPDSINIPCKYKTHSTPGYENKHKQRCMCI